MNFFSDSSIQTALNGLELVHLNCFDCHEILIFNEFNLLMFRNNRANMETQIL